MNQTALNLIGKITEESPDDLRRHEALITLKPQAKELFDLLPTLKGATLNKMIALARGGKAIPSADDEQEPLTITGPNAARRLGVSKATIWRMIKDGDLKTIEIRGKSRILKSSLTAFVRRNTKAA